MIAPARHNSAERAPWAGDRPSAAGEPSSDWAPHGARGGGAALLVEVQELAGRRDPWRLAIHLEQARLSPLELHHLLLARADAKGGEEGVHDRLGRDGADG